MLRDKDFALARVLYPRCHGEEGISGDGRLGSPFTSSIHHRTGNAFLFCAGGGEGERVYSQLFKKIYTVLFNCSSNFFFLFSVEIFFFNSTGFHYVSQRSGGSDYASSVVRYPGRLPRVV